MRQVLSLIAGKAKALGTTEIDRVQRALDEAQTEGGAPDWLSPGEACDIALEGRAEAALTRAREAFKEMPVDVNVVPATARRKKLLLADMDSTLIEQECIDELAAAIGLRERVAAITERAMRGEIDFEPALRERVGLFKGMPVGTIADVLATRITLSPGAATLVATMRAHGAHTMLVSGGFTLFTDEIAGRLGFHENRANVLLCEGGSFTGLAAEPVLGRVAKEQAFDEATKRLGIDPEETLAIGDGANDSGMIRRAGLGVAYRGKPALRSIADAVIDHGDLTAALFLQGYRRDEFAAANGA
ncbi:MAG: phosphoserine phosphatase SerB [Propylenella sp.]